MTHRFSAGTIGALAAALLLAFAPLSAAHATGAAASAPARGAVHAQRQLQTLAEAYYDAQARFEPIGATENGDKRYDHLLGMSIAPEQRARQFALLRGYAQTLAAIPRGQLSHADRVSYDILAYELDSALSFAPFPEHLLPLNQMDSLPVTLANYAGGEGAQPLRSVAE